MHCAVINAFVEYNPMYISLQLLPIKIIAALIIFPLHWIMHPSFIVSYLFRKNKELTYQDFLIQQFNENEK